MTDITPQSRAKSAFDQAIKAASPVLLMADALANLQKPVSQIIAIGKASGQMAQSCRDAGLTAPGVLVTHDDDVSVDGFEVIVGGHPLPNQGSLKAAERVLEIAENLTVDDHLLVLMSGGGSALMALPPLGISLEQKISIHDGLFTSGLDIHQMNAVRRLFSRVKGGRLARAAYPATITQWALSDVPATGDMAADLSAIASGPFAPDPIALDQAALSINQAEAFENNPEDWQWMHDLLAEIIADDGLAPLRAGDKAFDHVTTSILASNATCRKAAEDSLGDTTITLPDLSGDAGAMGAKLAEIALAESRGFIGVSGGETVVTIPPDHDPKYLGGRSQHLALTFLLTMAEAKLRGEETPQFVLLAAGTDGRDGPTDAAGAMVDSSMVFDVDQAREAAINFDSWHFLDAHDSLIKMPPTGTNLADIIILLTW